MPGRYERVCLGWHCAKVKGHAELKIEKKLAPKVPLRESVQNKTYPPPMGIRNNISKMIGLLTKLRPISSLVITDIIHFKVLYREYISHLDFFSQ